MTTAVGRLQRCQVGWRRRKLERWTCSVNRTATATDLGLINATAEHAEAVSVGNPVRDVRIAGLSSNYALISQNLAVSARNGPTITL